MAPANEWIDEEALMRARNDITRRHLLGMAGAAGVSAIAGAAGDVWAQAGKRIEQMVCFRPTNGWSP
jgi:hypothetical protein